MVFCNLSVNLKNTTNMIQEMYNTLQEYRRVTIWPSKVHNKLTAEMGRVDIKLPPGILKPPQKSCHAVRLHKLRRLSCKGITEACNGL